MGFPIQTNIFRAGAGESSYFRRFPVQVAVLFSPEDGHFVEAFRDLFLRLDRLTGERVVFFAVLDPPDDWLSAAGHRQAWQRYRCDRGPAGAGFDDRVLVHEIARTFGVHWLDLPALVAATDLWTAEFVTAPTSPYRVERQLRDLTRVVERWGRPHLGMVADALAEGLPAEGARGREPPDPPRVAASPPPCPRCGSVRHHPPDALLRQRLWRVYDLLAARPGELPRYHDHVRAEVQQSRLWLDLYRRGRVKEDRSGAADGLRFQESEDADLGSAYESLVEDAAGRLVVPATVAMRAARRLQESPDLPARLDPDSALMVDRALRNGHFLERVEEGDSPWGDLWAPSRRGGPATGGVAPGEDFTGGAQGVWKALELEVNLSAVQAARLAREVRMPQFHARYDPDLPEEMGTVFTDPAPVYINAKPWRNEPHRPGQHRFIELGTAKRLVRFLEGNPAEDFDEVLRRHLGGPLPEPLMRAWARVCRIRNPHSHTRPLSRAEYREILDLALRPEVLGPLLRLKAQLSRLAS